MFGLGTIKTGKKSLTESIKKVRLTGSGLDITLTVIRNTKDYMRKVFRHPPGFTSIKRE